MVRKVLGLAAAVACASVAVVPLIAHHSFAAEFDSNQPVTLKGKVTKVEWINPHIWLYIDVPEPSGQVVGWAIEGAAPNSMIRRGVRKDSVPIGVEITVEGFRAKSGKSVANGRNIQWPGGDKLFMGSSGTGAPDDPR
jgi:hypothetical protein